MRVVRLLPNQYLLAIVVSAALLQPGLSDKLFQTADKLAAKYVVGIERDENIAENEEEESGFSQHIRMTNSTGHAFDCVLPSPSQDTYLDTADNKGDTQQQELTSEQVLSTLSARCFYRLEDWWTYELCYEKHVRQFHREKEVLSSEYSLGVYEGEPAETDIMQGSVSEANNGKYVKQLYTQGDACDLTGQTRQTEVRYSCGKGGQEAILSIKEPSTCHYVLNMAVPGLCQMPTFQQQAEPVTQIVCKAIASPAAAQSSVVLDTQEKQQQQIDAEQSVQDIGDLVSEIIANGTELA
ncbi:TPA: hypothetical protein ACH3X1_010300 [Trebouxia sp. C0004]